MINGVVYRNKDQGYSLINLYTEKVYSVSEENLYKDQLTASSVALVEFTEPFQTVFKTKPVVIVLLTNTKDKAVDVANSTKDAIIDAAYIAAKEYMKRKALPVDEGFSNQT